MEERENKTSKFLMLTGMGITESYMKEMIASEDISIVVDMGDNEILYATEKADLLFGYIPGELQGMKLNEIIPERFHQIHDEHVHGYSNNPTKRLMGEKTGKRLVGKRKDGVEIEVEIGLSARSKNGVRFAIAKLYPKRD